MSEMVERVARAIYRTVADEDDWSDHGNDIDLQVEMHWEKCVPQARAAIAAMREPTRRMLDVMSPVDDSDPIDVAKANWQAGIDEALK